ncbi:hypothetical protein DYY65_03465 [Nitrososphaera sp. AFS]|nr:hypothetical protein [Nitrososphaera sp. AFS]
MEKFQKMEQLNICDILRSISDDKALTIFNTIALSNGSATIAISRLKLTRKQYYSRMSAMTNAGLITRRNGKFFLTSFGKVVYQAHILVGKAQQNYWKLKAVDAIESSNDGLATEDRNNFINNLIMDSDLKQILLSGDEIKDNSRKLIALQQT